MQDNVRALPTRARQRSLDAVLPRLPAHHVARPRLVQALVASHSQLTLVCAPAGFGKTVLINECARQAGYSTRLIWLDLLGHPITPAELLARLAAALQMSFGNGEACTELSHLLCSIEQPLWIMLDDYPREPCPELDTCLDALLERAPHTLRWWISGRRRPAWNLPRLQLQDDLQEIDANLLAANEDELIQLLEKRRLTIPAELQARLISETEGWLAGICLLVIGANAESLSERLAIGSPLLLQYIEREVLAALSEDLVQALLTLAHMPRFSAALCTHVLEAHGGAAALEALRDRQIFLQELDDTGTWFRLWRPFAATLKVRQDGRAARHAHVLACQWFATQGDVREAVEHSLWAGQPEVAASYLQRYGQDQLLIGQSVSQFLHWREELPASLFVSTPRLITMTAWALIICNRLDEVDACLANLAHFLPQPDPHRHQQLLAQYQTVLGVLHRQRGWRSAGQHCQEALAVLDKSAWSLRIACHQALAQHAAAELDLNRAQQHSRDGLRLAQAVDNVPFATLLSVDLIHQLSMLGQNEQALEQTEQSLQLSEAAGLRGPVRARLLILRGHLLASSGDTEKAKTILQQGVQEAEACEDAYLLFGYLDLAGLAADDGQFDLAQQLLRRAEKQMHAYHVPDVRYREALLLAQGELWLRKRKVDKARQAFTEVRQRLEDDQLLAPSGFYDLLLRARLNQARADISLGSIGRAEQELQALLQTCQHTGHHTLATLVRLSLAEALRSAGNQVGADEQLAKVLTEAERQHLLQPLLVLQRREPEWLARTAEHLDHSTDWRLNLHLAINPDAAPPSPTNESQLSKREIAVLELIARGYSNLQIADTLFISIHTVKTHARRINAKLGVQSRTQAIARAKQEGLL